MTHKSWEPSMTVFAKGTEMRFPRAAKLRRAFPIGALLLLLAENPAAAHVQIDPDTASPGYTKLYFWLYHGCGDAPTASFTVRIPQGVVDVTPQVKAGWKIETVTTTYPQPVRIYGRTVSKGFTEITWSGDEIPAHFMDHFIIAAFVAQGAAERLQFTTIQRCRGTAQPEESTLTLRVTHKARAAEPAIPRGDEGGAPARSGPPQQNWFREAVGPHTRRMGKEVISHDRARVRRSLRD